MPQYKKTEGVPCHFRYRRRKIPISRLKLFGFAIKYSLSSVYANGKSSRGLLRFDSETASGMEIRGAMINMKNGGSLRRAIK